ncbi:type IV pilus twitching motility protein PilT [Demequina sp. NBRC 110052]|uniref:type IV pilus twitching motility protein PilT n=1 Tax=Demequina sp. NBRC 110052 TaxID=1570341 RepID=UPI0009FC7AED|nr:PilT/PilU family type 4a pilus ATPase [Demequina sp. NBRC 110052]
MSEQPVSVIPFLHALASTGGSDLHCKVGSAPRIRVDGRLRKLQVPPLTPEDTRNMVAQVLPEELVAQFRDIHEADFAFSLSGVGRFRVNAYVARGTDALVFRRVAVGAQPMEELGLPEVIGDLAMEPRGLVLVTGPTGSGKTTTLASMVDLINENKEVNIITIEDPIEVLHQDKKAIISQREVRSDTMDFTNALRGAMRQDPDVILVGEMRDIETVRAALTAAETGHLVLATLHTVDAQDTINRIVDFFTPHEQGQIRATLSQTLRGIVSQRLVKKADGSGRKLVAEVMINHGRTAEAIVDPSTQPPLLDLIAEGEYYKMQTFDQHLFVLVRDGEVAYDDAISIASRPHDLSVTLRNAGVIV